MVPRHPYRPPSTLREIGRAVVITLPIAVILNGVLAMLAGALGQMELADAWIESIAGLAITFVLLWAALLAWVLLGRR